MLSTLRKKVLKSWANGLETQSSKQFDKLLRLIGLGARGRMVVVGVDQVRNAAQRGKLQAAVVARDAAQNSLDKVVPLLKARGVEVIDGPEATQLGATVGKDAVAVIGILDSSLAKGIRETVLE